MLKPHAVMVIYCYYCRLPYLSLFTNNNFQSYDFFIKPPNKMTNSFVFTLEIIIFQIICPIFTHRKTIAID